METINTTHTVRVARTERERVQGISSESSRAVRAYFESENPTARIAIACTRADAETLTFKVAITY
ncbi:hypothetical protein EPO05_06595 [Patescibacteria group bacterium]|nr:MAG: hypothetical protein EPO05_06595 [Patescibacteria group bacterium]